MVEFFIKFVGEIFFKISLSNYVIRKRKIFVIIINLIKKFIAEKKELKEKF